MARTLEEAYRDLADFHQAGDVEAAKAAAEYIRKLENEQPGGFASGLGKIQKAATDAVRGAGLTAEFIGKGESAHPISFLGKVLRERLVGKLPPVSEMLPVPVDETAGEKLARKGFEGLGGSLVMPVGGLVPAAAAGFAGGVTGELGRRTGEKIAGSDPEKAWIPAAGEITGELLGGGGTGFLTGPKQTLAQRHLREAAEGMGPEDWAKVQGNIRDFGNVGAKTATLGEAFPLNSSMMDLTREARAGSTQNALKQAVEERAGDIQQLAAEAQRRAGGAISPAATANRVAAAANAVMEGTNDLASNAVGNRLAGVSLPKKDVAEIYTQLRTFAGRQDRIQPELAKAYREVADQLLSGDRKTFLSDLQGISFQLKGLKDSPVNPTASAGTKGADAVWRKAIGAAEKLLGQKSPEWQGAMDDFAGFQQSVVSPQRESLVGRLGDRNIAAPDAPTPFAKLDAFVTGNTPAETRGAVRLLGEPQFAGQEAIPAEDIARAILAKRLEKGPSAPGPAVRGSAGSATEAQLAEILALSGKDPKQTLLPLDVADRLTTLNNPAGTNVMPEMRWWQMALRPFRTMDMLITGQGEKGMHQALAEILADPKRLEELRKAAKFDPNARRMLMLVPAINAAGQNQGVE